MKKLVLTTLLLLTSAATLAKQLSDADRTFDLIVDTPGKSKDQIYLSSKVWIAESFKSSKAVLEIDSKQDGLLLGNAIIKYPCKGFSCITYEGWTSPFTLKIEMKEEKFRVTFSNIQLSLPGQPGYSAPSTFPITEQSDLDRIKPALVQLAHDLENAVKRSSSQQDF